MKIRKSLLIVLLLSFGLTGCYTQLEYSQKMNRVTSDKPNTGYAWNDETEERANLTEADSIYIAETYGAKVEPYREGEYAEDGEYVNYDDEYAYYDDEEYIPVQYKNYDVIDTYEACGCNPYKTYVINNSYYPASSWYHGSSYYHSYRYHHWPSYHTFGRPYYGWSWKYHVGFNYYHRGFGLAFHWGSPYHYYYDRFFYDPFYYGYASPIFYNNFNYFAGSYYTGTLKSTRSDRRYGRRSIGSDRVRNRSNETVRSRSGITRDKASTNTVRSRSTGVQRTRGTVQNTRSTTTRTRGTTRVGSSSRSRSDSGTRSRGTVKRSRSNDGGNSARSRGSSNVKRDRDNSKDQAVNTRRRSVINNRSRVLPAQSDRAKIESKIRQQRVRKPEANKQRSRSSFLGRFKSMFNSSGSIHNSRRSNSSRSYGIPSKSSRSRVGTSRSSGNSSRTTVRSSRSSSSKSSSTRSRSSSSKKRDRGNN